MSNSKQKDNFTHFCKIPIRFTFRESDYVHSILIKKMNQLGFSSFHINIRKGIVSTINLNFLDSEEREKLIKKGLDEGWDFINVFGFCVLSFRIP